jgi:hypothetical protein
MREFGPAIALLLIISATMGAVQAESPSDIRISEVYSKPLEGDRELIELVNTGSQTIDLEGWTIQDSTNGTNQFTIPKWMLEPGGRIVIWGGGEADSLGPAWKANVWNNGGDDVRLYAPDGEPADFMTYGSSDVPAPPIGESLHGPDSWIAGPPTPGQNYAGTDGGATAHVNDVPPEVQWTSVPTTLRPGDLTVVSFFISDGNGDNLTWSLGASQDNGTSNGTGEGGHAVELTAPGVGGPWELQLLVQSTTLQTTVNHTVMVHNGTFRVAIPDGGIRFDNLDPGATNVAATAAFVVHNDDSDSMTPYLDISPLSSSTDFIGVDGNLELHINSTDGTSSVVVYAGPLQALPTLGPAQSLTVSLVIIQVPMPLPAGDYRSSFAVVA